MLLEARQAGIDSGKQLGSPAGVGLTDGAQSGTRRKPLPWGGGDKGLSADNVRLRDYAPISQLYRRT